MVELANRRPMLFTADACYSKKNMDMNCISSFHLDPTASLRSMHRLRRLAEQHDAGLFLLARSTELCGLSDGGSLL